MDYMIAAKNQIAKSLRQRTEKILHIQHATIDDCKSIIVDSCQWTEASRKNGSSLTLKLYRNWLSHPALTKGFVLDFFKEIYQQFSIPEANQSTVDRIADLLSSKKLRHELKTILKSIGCNFPVLDSLSMWKQFFGSICAELLYKPLVLTSCEQLLEHSSEPGEYKLPKHFRLEDTEGKIEFAIQIIHLVKENDGNIKEIDASITVRGNFPLNESRINFHND